MATESLPFVSASTIFSLQKFKDEEKARALRPAFSPKNTQYVELRSSPRSKVSACLRLWLDNGIMLEGVARDLSVRGVCFESPNALPIGNPVRVELRCDQSGCAVSVKIQGTVVRIEEGALAVEFAELPPDLADQLCAILAQ